MFSLLIPQIVDLFVLQVRKSDEPAINTEEEEEELETTVLDVTHIDVEGNSVWILVEFCPLSYSFDCIFKEFVTKLGL